VKTHSPIVVGLLLAATAAVDVVVAKSLVNAGQMSRVSFVFDALIVGQLSAVSAWAVLGARRAWMGGLAVLTAVGAAGLLLARVAELSIAEACGIYGSLVAILVVVLWAIKQTPLWRRLTNSGSAEVWQFSLVHLMLAMTAVAVLITALRGSLLLFEAGDSWKFLVSLTLADVILVVTTILTWTWASWLPHWWPRLGAAIAPAFVVGGVNTALMRSGLLGAETAALQRQAPFDLIAYALMVSVVIFVYLEIAPLIARGDSPEQLSTDGTED
jgi:hypothetical protein